MSEVKVKGTIVQEALRAMRKRMGEPAYLRLLHALPAVDQAALEEPILVTAWYPLDAFVRLAEAGVRLEDHGDPGPFSRRSEALVDFHLDGIYRRFAELGSPDALVRRVAAAHHTYFHGSEVEVVEAAPGHARVRYRGFAGRHRLMELAIRAFYRRALERSGAEAVEVRFTVPMNDDLGYAEATLRWRVAAVARPPQGLAAAAPGRPAR
jgi:hypothetical protein